MSGFALLYPTYQLDRKGRSAIIHTTDYLGSGYAKGKRVQVQERLKVVG